MKMSFRWYGPGDPVTLANIRQIPALTGIVTALYDVRVQRSSDLPADGYAPAARRIDHVLVVSSSAIACFSFVFVTAISS